jgi:RimJ/RimL family protein N-acetyltransferase
VLAAALAEPALRVVRRFQGHVARDNIAAIRCAEAAGFAIDPDDDLGDEHEVALVYQPDRVPRTIDP